MNVRPAFLSQGSDQSQVYEEVWLRGQPPLQSYLDFIDDTALVPHVDRAAVVAEWRAANDYYGELEAREADIADEAEVLDLDPALGPLVEQLMADPRYRRTFDLLPTRVAMVELDRLLVGHPYVSLNHTERLKAQLGPAPAAEALFRFCLPLDREEAGVQMRRIGPRRFLFWSHSTDFRFQETVVLRPDQINGLEAYGAMAGLVGLAVGYGSNFLNVIEYGGRLLLHNGHHRAYALRDLGRTHAPCIVQTVTREDELKIAATTAVREDPAFYFRAARPPLLKDFFDPRIRKVIRVPRTVATVEVSFEVSELKMKDFASVD